MGWIMKQAIVVRKDLKMRKGKLVAQCCHGSNMVLRNYYGTDKIERWIQEYDYTKILLGCDSEQELLNLHQSCCQNNIPCFLVKDKGYTEFGGKETLTCIAVGPDENEKINELCGNFNLL